MSVAERLYYLEQERLDFVAEVTDIRLESRVDGVNRWQVALDRTAFYPESGGQPWDTGVLEAVARSGARLQVPVLAVVEDAGEVWHVVEKPLTAGTAITGHLDADRRRDHMQQHTGQHLLSAVFLRELGAATVSFHLGAESSTIDLAGEMPGPQEVARVEEVVNRLIAEDRPVTVSTVDRGTAEAMLARGDLRKLPERQGPLRVVEIAGVEWNACGGTHVASTGRIGGLTVRRLERVKGATRVEFCCGLRAIRAARADFATLGELGRLLSTGADALPAKVSGMLEESRAAGKARRALIEKMAGFEAAAHAGTGLVEAAAHDVEYAKLLAGNLAAQPGRTALVTALEGDRATVVLASSGVNCGAVMKDALSVLGARGGGSTTLAQGGIAAAELGSLLAELRKRLS